MNDRLYKVGLRRTFNAVVLLAVLSAAIPLAADAHETDTIALPQVKVIGEDQRRLFKGIPGSVHVMDRRDLARVAPVSANDVLRKIPGLNIIDEDGGAGLRVNIGVRGLNPIRSSKVLVMEDGIPVTLNPYGDPALYFSPLMDKMDGVEVLKGSSQLLFGPQTIGGVVNYITANPPEQLTNRVKIAAGEGGYFSSFLSHGNTIGNVGYIISYNHKRADNMGPLEYRINNLTGKLTMKLSEHSRVGFKFGIDDQRSNATYVGLTQSLYDAGKHDFTTLAPHDYMPIANVNASLTHEHDFNERVTLRTVAFAYAINRNWRRQAYDRAPVDGRVYDRIWGDPAATDGSTLFMRDAADWRNRQYQVKGVEPRLAVKHALFNVPNDLKVGVRALWERADEQFVQSGTANGRGGNMRDNEQRFGFATSAYVVNDINITDKFTANVGLRMEHYDFERRIYRGRYTVNGQPNVVRDTLDSKSSSTFALLPGAGLSYAVSENVTLFAGVHRGFAPPAVKSAILPEGVAEEIDKEVSTNYELGGRISVGDYLNFSPTLFYMDFENQVVPVSGATGATSANGGRTQHLGAEFGVDFDLAKALGSAHSVALGGTLTFVEATYAGKDNVLSDNYLPYSPKIIANQYVSVELWRSLGLAVYGNYMGKQFNDSNNTVTPSVDGQIGQIDARFIMDATIYYRFNNPNIMLHASAKNLTNTRYIASRNPQGIRLGMDRFISAGIDFTF